VKRAWLWALICANLAALIALAFVYPDLMVSPGPLTHGHEQVQKQCFSCHRPWRGSAASLCLKCHVLAQIGLRTTKGVAPSGTRIAVPFHQQLIEHDCMACHSDHAGPKFTEHSRKHFSHALLQSAVRDRCETCHARPDNEMHRALLVGCAICHGPDRWKPAAFDHASLASAVLARCDGCHQSPKDSLHRQVTGSCGQCHRPGRWKPATFEHDRYFLLDSDHNVRCNVCHGGEGYRAYSCFGCHEHRADEIRARHEEEGIRNFEDCARCHRSPDAEAEGNGLDGGRERD